ncbi:L-rhamnose mutarotase [Actinoalloteichus sp. AHMU CJ021]|uniref:L-rhamnose mutarotase n=1 Tax=Actinoalloteichus caeruleus DSM 43889 TaxID=1120930 RepID=A0ABT1JNI5_ACTCY|nr:L-rhamnose mutarotase [Actinoalloteichus caeruleus]AUS79906.1 L-rhamnose mutarotase [Actinoalloteichus sp. AHMU CJ021]MCP2334085.1 L-rhamnose mutarotase [Actinoalloteichus caeruleus DSM 43889]
MRRVAQVIRVRPEMLAEYRRLHEEVWPAVLDRIRHANIRNYSIHLRDDLLFSYFEYHGTDLAADLASMAEDPVTQRWWRLTDPCQRPLASAGPGEWWAPAEQVFLMEE